MYVYMYMSHSWVNQNFRSLKQLQEN